MMTNPLLSGMLCEACGEAIYGTYSTRLAQIEGERVRIRYYRCPRCGNRPIANKVLIPERFAPKRLGSRGFQLKKTVATSSKVGRGKQK